MFMKKTALKSNAIGQEKIPGYLLRDKDIDLGRMIICAVLDKQEGVPMTRKQLGIYAMPLVIMVTAIIVVSGLLAIAIKAGAMYALGMLK